MGGETQQQQQQPCFNRLRALQRQPPLLPLLPGPCSLSSSLTMRVCPLLAWGPPRWSRPCETCCSRRGARAGARRAEAPPRLLCRTQPPALALRRPLLGLPVPVASRPPLPPRRCPGSTCTRLSCASRTGPPQPTAGGPGGGRGGDMCSCEGRRREGRGAGAGRRRHAAAMPPRLCFHLAPCMRKSQAAPRSQPRPPVPAVPQWCPQKQKQTQAVPARAYRARPQEPCKSWIAARTLRLALRLDARLAWPCQWWGRGGAPWGPALRVALWIPLASAMQRTRSSSSLVCMPCRLLTTPRSDVAAGH